MLQDMTPLGRRCFPPFSFLGFIAWSMPWLPSDCAKNSEQTFDYLQSAATLDQTGESLSVVNSDLRYLTLEEAEQIIDRFKEIPHSSNRLLFWTGIPKSWVQQWAGEHGLLTLTSAMGPLMDNSDPRCLRCAKTPRQWSKYIKGASGIFARYACGHGIVRVLTLPPSCAEFLRAESSYLTIEEPVLKGTSGGCCAVQINTVHLLESSTELEYQSWPQNRMSEIIAYGGDDSFNFKLPRWILKKVKAAGQVLRSRVVRLTASTTSEPTDTISISYIPQQRSSVLAAKKQQECSERQNTSHAPKEYETQQLARTRRSNTKAQVLEEKAGKPRSNQRPGNKRAKSKPRPQINTRQTQSDKQQPPAKHPQRDKHETESEQRPGSKRTKSERSLQSIDQERQNKCQGKKRQPHSDQQAIGQQSLSHIRAQRQKQQGTREYPVVPSSSLKQRYFVDEGARQGEAAIKSSLKTKRMKKRKE